MVRLLPNTVSSPGVGLLSMQQFSREELLINIANIWWKVSDCMSITQQRFQSCDLMCTTIIHSCVILLLAQAHPKIPCIYTSKNPTFSPSAKHPLQGSTPRLSTSLTLVLKQVKILSLLRVCLLYSHTLTSTPINHLLYILTQIFRSCEQLIWWS